MPLGVRVNTARTDLSQPRAEGPCAKPFQKDLHRRCKISDFSRWRGEEPPPPERRTHQTQVASIVVHALLERIVGPEQCHSISQDCPSPASPTSFGFCNLELAAVIENSPCIKHRRGEITDIQYSDAVAVNSSQFRSVSGCPGILMSRVFFRCADQV